MSPHACAPPRLLSYRLSEAAILSLTSTGNAIRETGTTRAPPSLLDPARPPSLQDIDVPLYDIELRLPPPGLTMCLVGAGKGQHAAIRCSNDPPFAGEWPAAAVAWHERGQLVPCPRCGAALVWYEAGYVPGYRLCLVGHHAQLSSDGTAAQTVRRGNRTDRRGRGPTAQHRKAFVLRAPPELLERAKIGAGARPLNDWICEAIERALKPAT